MQPNNPYQPAPPPQPHEYDFLMSSQKPPRRGFSLPGGSSMPVRIALVAGGLLLLLIIFSVAKSALSGSGNVQALTAVVQDQQQLVHLAQNASQDSQATLSTTNQNFAVTAGASLASAQSQLITYMKDNGHGVGKKTLALGVSATLDDQMNTAIANTTYDSTFKSVMQTQLSKYQQALKTAYQQTKGPKGRKLLTDQFNASQLLIQQLNTPAS